MPADAPAAFFSYSREDEEFALRLAEDLRAAGANVWIDQLDLVGGQRWDRQVQDALNRCPSMLVILSPAAVNSDNVLDEVARALKTGKPVIPVFYLDCDIPYRLERFQQVDFRKDYSRGFRLLLKAMGVVQPMAAAAAAAAAAPAAPKESPPAATDTGVRKMVAEQVELELQRRQAAERGRQEQERQQAAENARLEEEERERLAALAAAEQSRLEQEERDRQAAAEKARLEQEERERQVAAEKARQEQERLAAEKARREQLEREREERLEEKRRAAEEAGLEQAKHERQAAFAAEEKARREQQERERQAVAEKARLHEQERQRLEAHPSGAAQPADLALFPPGFKKIAAIVGGIVLVVVLLYWAARPTQHESEIPNQVVKNETPAPPLSGETPRTQAADDRLGSVRESYRNGDSSSAVPLLEQQVKDGNAEAMYFLAMHYDPDFPEYKGVAKNSRQAAKLYEMAAQAGNSKAMFYIGWDFQKGEGVPRDYQQAVGWYGKAAEAGNPVAMNSLGFMYYNGYGVQKDYTEAVNWFRKAAEAGNGAGMRNLGIAYENGEGVPKSRREAISWYHKAAQLGDGPAKSALRGFGESVP